MGKTKSTLEVEFSISADSVVSLSDSNRPVTLHTGGPSAVVNVHIGDHHVAYLIMTQDALEALKSGKKISTAVLEDKHEPAY